MLDTNWIDPNEKTPTDKQLCELIIDFTFVIYAKMSNNMKTITEASRFKAIYNEKDSNWILTDGFMPHGYINNRVIKWRPIKEGVINANRN